VFIVVIYFVNDSVRKLLETPSYSEDRNHIYKYRYTFWAKCCYWG